MGLRGFIIAAALFQVGCGLLSESPTSPLGIAFHGYSPSLALATAELRVSVEGHSWHWTGDHSASEHRPHDVATLDLSSNRLVTAQAVLRSATGTELARASVTIEIQRDYLYGIGFQAGGRNPDTRGFCHQSPTPVAIPGFPGDSLYVWKSGLPRGAVC